MKDLSNKKIFITIDFEEWFHITYLEKYGFEQNITNTYADKTFNFFEKLTKMGIKATVFVVGEIVEKNKEILRRIAALGHEIACHSLNHNILCKLTDTAFIEETKTAKNLIEKTLMVPVYGFRAPSFSLDNNKLAKLKELGFEYDSSYVNFKENEYSNILDITSFNKITTNIYFKNKFYEFELPNVKFFSKKLPIGGGGFFRLYPLFLYKIFVKKYLKKHDSFIFFIHPYEIDGSRFSNEKLLSFKDRIRMNLNRKNAANKALSFFKFLKNKNVVFSTFHSYCKSQKN